MSTTALIIPHDASVSTPRSSLQDVDPAQLWATAVPDSAAPLKVGSTRTFYGPANDARTTVLTSLGEKFSEKTGNARAEVVRKAVGSAVKNVKGMKGIKDILVDASLDPHASAVAAHLALYKFALKTSPPSAFRAYLERSAPEEVKIAPVDRSEDWDRGVVYAYSQNLARTLTELPANMMTPTNFCTRVQAEFGDTPNVKINVHDKEWASKLGMRTFLSVARGTAEPPKFLEIHYRGDPDANAAPLAFVGKGITFDTGGICLKPGTGMKLMRGDMGGAASVVSAALAVAKFRLPINLVVVAPLSENMPGPTATKPGDIIYAMNGKSVEVDNTDAEGRLVLADALYYVSNTFKPHTVIDVATLTGAMDVALGEIFTGVFSSSDKLWNRLHAAGESQYDRFWRMPLDEDFGPQIHSSNADLCNTGGKQGGACTAALFLKAFVDGLEDDKVEWAHLDIAGTMEVSKATPYLEKGMSGRSVRALIEYARLSSTEAA